MQITSVEKSKKNKNLISVFVDEKCAFSISEEDFLSMNLYEKKELSEEEIGYIKSTLSFRTAKTIAVGYLSFKLRTEMEVREKLLNEGFVNETIHQVIDELKAIGYINNKMYAQKYVYDRSKLKPKSKRLLKLELIGKGISEEIADEVLENWDVDECAVAEGLVKKKFGKYDLSDDSVMKKAFMFLRHRGYKDEIIETAINKCAQINNNE